MAALTLFLLLAATVAGMQGRWGASTEFRLVRFAEGALWLIAAACPLVCGRLSRRIDRAIVALAPVVALPLTFVTMNLEMDLFVEFFDPPCGNFIIGYMAKGLWTCVVTLMAVGHFVAQCLASRAATR
ncbi:MAG: hypothetical protein ACYTGX_00130 [Planctomycetota bacterium]